MMRAVLATLAMLCASGAQAHDAGGWQYDQDCCSAKDCTVIPAEHTPRITPWGYILHDGQSVEKDSPKRRDSKDIRWHRCDGHHTLGPRSLPFVRCLYVPSGGM